MTPNPRKLIAKGESAAVELKRSTGDLRDTLRLPQLASVAIEVRP